MRLTKLLHTFFICMLMSIATPGSAVQAPEWSLKDAQGNSVKLSDYKGKVLLLHFWATWCPYCKKVQPGLERLYTQYKDQGVEVLGISGWEDPGTKPQQTLKKRGHTFKTLINGDEVAKQYGIKGTPTTLYIDRKGQIKWATNTSNPKDPELEAQLQSLLKTKS